MLRRMGLCVALLAAVPGWSQQQDNPQQTPEPANSSEMMTPPPVSGQAYPVQTHSEEQSNFLSFGLMTGIAYDDNVFAGFGSTPQGETSYIVAPTVTLNTSTKRTHQVYTYAPGFTFYEPTSDFNEADQNATANVHYRVTPHWQMNVQDAFLKSSSVFTQAGALTGGGVTGITPVQATGVVAPFADRITNTANGDVSAQLSEHSMLGFSGISGQLDYPDSSQVPGLYNSNSFSGSGFYNQRISTRQYLGGTYMYGEVSAYPQKLVSRLDTQMISGFYTIYVENTRKSTLTFSLTAGPERYHASQYGTLPVQAWTPTVTAGSGWQGLRTSLAGTYSRAITAGGGLSGAFRENSGTVTARWSPSQEVRLGASAFYADTADITPQFQFSQSGGRTLSVTGSLQRAMSKQVLMEFGYNRLHQKYSGIQALAVVPDSNRVYVSLTWQYNRPLGNK